MYRKPVTREGYLQLWEQQMLEILNMVSPPGMSPAQQAEVKFKLRAARNSLEKAFGMQAGRAGPLKSM